MENNKVSIIIPVYKVEKYITECIEAAIHQTYRDLEIILIDDGSPDQCSAICDEYASKDSRIVVIHQKNAGLSAARNVALDQMNGGYVYFYDSDDVINYNAIEILLSLIKKGADIAVTGLRGFEGNVVSTSKPQGDQIFYGTEEALGVMLQRQKFGHEACGKLFKRELWKNHRFPVGELYEDYSIIYKIIMIASHIGYYSEPLYYYRTVADSIMHSKIKDKNLILISISEKTTKDIVRQYPNLREQAVGCHVVTCMKLLEQILATDRHAYIKEQELILNEVKANRKMLLVSRTFRRVDKIKIMALCIGKRPFFFLYQIGEKINERKRKQ